MVQTTWTDGQTLHGVDVTDIWDAVNARVDFTTQQTVSNKIIGNYLDCTSYTAVGGPTAPTVPGTVRFFSRIGNSGLDAPAWVGSAGIPMVIGRDVGVFAKNNTGVTITKGTAVYIASASGSMVNIAKAQADPSMTKMPVLGIVAADILSSKFGLVMQNGVITNMNTTTSLLGATGPVFLDATTPGALTVTPPAHPNATVPLGMVINVQASTGSILVTVDQHINNKDQGTNLASWAIGDGTGTAATRSLLFKNTFTGTLSWAPTAARTLTLPDAGGTLYVVGGALGTPASGSLANCTGLPMAGLATTGTRDNTKFLRDDGSWQSVTATVDWSAMPVAVPTPETGVFDPPGPVGGVRIVNSYIDRENTFYAYTLVTNGGDPDQPLAMPGVMPLYNAFSQWTTPEPDSPHDIPIVRDALDIPVQDSLALADTASQPGHAHAITDITGTVPIAQIPTGTTGTTVAFGNHAHSGAAITSGKVLATYLPVGTTSTDVAAGNDTRLVAVASKLDIAPRVTLNNNPAAGAITINVGTTDLYKVTGLAQVISFVTTGTAADGQQLTVRVKDAGVAKGITFNTANFTATGIGALPTTTVINKTHNFIFAYDSVVGKWACMRSDTAGY